MWLTFHRSLRALSETNRRKNARRPRVSTYRPRLETLEDRTLLSAYVVTTTADNGDNTNPIAHSLRDAIIQINTDTTHTQHPSPNDGSVDEIDFQITNTSDTGGGFDANTGVATIAPFSALPDITNSVFINGYSQPGSSWNTLANDDNAVLRIQLNGRMNSVNGSGLTIDAGNSTVRGLVINGFFNGSGISLQGAGDRVQGNFIGTDVSGTSAPYGLPDFTTVSASLDNGVLVKESTGFQQDYIGTDSMPDPIDPSGWSDLAERNIISATGVGVKLIGPSVSDPGAYGSAQINNVVAGNFIGTDVHGSTALGNWAGISMQSGTHDDLIGTNGDGVNDAGERNVISGNFAGLVLNSPQGGIGEFRSAVAGNWIGTDPDGGPVGNLAAGVAVLQSALDLRIGGPSAPLGNTIAYNGAAAASLQNEVPSQGTLYAHAAGVWIFTLATSPQGITVEGNSIFGNSGLGIDLGGSYPPLAADGVTLNDSEGHVGPNDFQNFPVLNSAVSSNSDSSITGTFSSGTVNGLPFEPNTTITLDFYANSGEDPSGYGQGQTYLGSAQVTTDANGNAPYSVDFGTGNLGGQWITATATVTDTNSPYLGDTSEFTADIQATAAPSGQNYDSTYLESLLPQSSTTSNQLSIQTGPNLSQDTVISAVNGLTAPSQPVTIILNLNGGTYDDTTVNPPANVTLVINGANGSNTYDGHSPAFTVTGGTVIVRNVTFTTATDAPTILVTGGSLTLRNDVVQESTSYTDAAISITGGTLDLGTDADPGGNTINVNGSGAFVTNTTELPIAASGTTFTVNGVALAPDSLSGIVFKDFNDDGQVDFGEQGIAGVAVALAGTDFLGNAVSMSATTDSDGAYIFANLQPGAYSITETQPAGYNQGIDTVGTAAGSLTATDKFFVSLAQDASGLNGLNYNFGEQPQASGGVQKGQTAGIGFWNNKNGQALITSFNGGWTSIQLAAWLAATLPHMFGVDAGSNALIHADGSYFTNSEVAARFQQDFVLKGVKLDAQVLATALSVYATNATLDDTGVAANYGFTVGGDGVGTSGVNVGSNGDAFGVANNTVLTVLDLLKATDALAVDGLLYNGDAVKRKDANTVYSAINDGGN